MQTFPLLKLPHIGQILARSHRNDLIERDLVEQDRNLNNSQTSEETINIIKTIQINLNGFSLPWPLYSEKVSRKIGIKHLIDKGTHQLFQSKSSLCSKLT